jgi:hypothetical protein
MSHWLKSSGLGTATIATLALSGLMLLGAPRGQANECQDRIRHADHELHKAAKHHGRDSPQAAERRRELAEARAWCWENHHRWWNEEEHRWHTERDWDDHDHDRH